MDAAALKKILSQTASISDGYEVELMGSSKMEALTRFGQNKISQHVESEEMELVIRVQKGRRQGRASCNQTDRETVARTLRKAIHMSESQRDQPDLLPLLTPQNYRPHNHLVKRTMKISPEERADAIADAVSLCQKKKVTAAGIFSSGYQTIGIANSAGLLAFGGFSTASFSLTAMTHDSSGWAESTTRNIDEINAVDLARIAIDKALTSQRPKTVSPGRYAVVLEPAAVAELLLFMAWEAFGALPYQEDRSFLSAQIGQPLMDETVSLMDDAFHLLTISLPFDFEGVPRQPVPLIEKGIGRGVVYDRKTALKDNVSSTGHSLPQPNSCGPLPMNLVMSAGDSSVQEMIANTERGLLVTHFHYTNLIDPLPLSITGMTRNGTFLIEKGRIRHPVKNLRFTESIVEAFNRVEAIGRDPIYASSFWEGGIICPAMAIRDFNFSSSTTF